MEGYRLTYASLYEVQAAANAILTRCRNENRLEGGSVTNIGQYDDSSPTTIVLPDLSADCIQAPTADLR